MDLREFWRFHFLKALLGLVAIQLIIVAVVQNYNHKPEAIRDELGMIQDREQKIKPLMNDTDKDEHAELAIQTFTQPLYGKGIQKGNYIYYTPNAGFVGVDSMAYSITDGEKESKMNYIVVNVNPNLAPVGNRDDCMAYTKNKIILDVLSNDEDLEGDSIFIESFTQGFGGEVILEHGTLFYKAGSTVLIDSFSYTLSDGNKVSEKVIVQVDVKGEMDAYYPWFYGDVGNAAIHGSLFCAKGQIIVEASGSDIWDNQDGMYFVHQLIEGDCEIVVQVENFEAGHEWAKAGLMFRESLSGGAANFYAGITIQHGVGVQYRLNADEGTNALDGNEAAETPYWLKIKRTGNAFIAYCSKNGQRWEQVGEMELEMSKSICVGMCVTSHDNSVLAKAVFSNVTILK